MFHIGISGCELRVATCVVRRPAGQAGVEPWRSSVILSCCTANLNPIVLF